MDLSKKTNTDGNTKVISILGVLLISIVIFFYFVADQLHAPCEKFIRLSNDKENMLMLLRKLSFFVEDPEFLRSYELINRFPNMPIRHFHDIGYSLSINWESLDIIPKNATFRFVGRPDKPPLDYLNLSADSIESIVISERTRVDLIMSIKGTGHTFSENPEVLIRYLDITVNCSN